jgi:hypothetical protein
VGTGREDDLAVSMDARRRGGRNHAVTGVPPNKGMKLTNLSEAPGETEAPLRAFRRFAAVRTGSQLIPGVRRTSALGGVA